jgi:predicted transcriptional regulator
LECLKALWRLRQGTVHEVRDIVGRDKKLAYTTVMTVLERLSRRGAVERQRQGRAFVYMPRLDREKALDAALRELVGIYFDGSIDGLRRYLDGSAEPAATPSESPPIDAVLL